MEALAIVLPPQEEASMAQLATFTITKAGWLTNVSDNVFNALLRDNPKLVWTVKSDDENLTCKYPSLDFQTLSLESCLSSVCSMACFPGLPFSLE